MSLYVTTHLISAILVAVVSCLLVIAGIWIFNKFYLSDGWFEALSSAGIVCSAISGLVMLIALIIIGVFIMGSICQRAHEPVIYQGAIQEQASLQDIINSSEDVINTDIYQRAINFNQKLAERQIAQDDPRYSMSFSGEVDWNSIPFIDLS